MNLDQILALLKLEMSKSISWDDQDDLNTGLAAALYELPEKDLAIVVARAARYHDKDNFLEELRKEFAKLEG